MSKPRFTRPLTRYAGYIFDCDGTLADSMPLHFEAWRSALEACGATFEFTWKLFTSRGGMSLEETVLELNREFGCHLPEARVAELQRAGFAERLGELRPIEEVVVFAREVSKEAKVSVASGNARPYVLRSLELIGLSSIFDIVVTPELVKRGKPHPDMFLLAAELMGVSPSACLVLEDSPLGLEAAKRAGMACAMVEEALPALVETR